MICDLSCALKDKKEKSRLEVTKLVDDAEAIIDNALSTIET